MSDTEVSVGGRCMVLLAGGGFVPADLKITARPKSTTVTRKGQTRFCEGHLRVARALQV